MLISYQGQMRPIRVRIENQQRKYIVQKEEMAQKSPILPIEEPFIQSEAQATCARIQNEIATICNERRRHFDTLYEFHQNNKNSKASIAFINDLFGKGVYEKCQQRDSNDIIQVLRLDYMNFYFQALEIIRLEKAYLSPHEPNASLDLIYLLFYYAKKDLRKWSKQNRKMTAKDHLELMYFDEILDIVFPHISPRSRIVEHFVGYKNGQLDYSTLLKVFYRVSKSATLSIEQLNQNETITLYAKEGTILHELHGPTLAINLRVRLDQTKREVLKIQENIENIRTKKCSRKGYSKKLETLEITAIVTLADQLVQLKEFKKEISRIFKEMKSSESETVAHPEKSDLEIELETLDDNKQSLKPKKSLKITTIDINYPAEETGENENDFKEKVLDVEDESALSDPMNQLEISSYSSTTLSSFSSSACSSASFTSFSSSSSLSASSSLSPSISSSPAIESPRAALIFSRLERVDYLCPRKTRTPPKTYQERVADKLKHGNEGNHLRMILRDETSLHRRFTYKHLFSMINVLEPTFERGGHSAGSRISAYIPRADSTGINPKRDVRISFHNLHWPHAANDRAPSFAVKSIAKWLKEAGFDAFLQKQCKSRRTIK